MYVHEQILDYQLPLIITCRRGCSRLGGHTHSQTSVLLNLKGMCKGMQQSLLIRGGGDTLDLHSLGMGGVIING